MRPDQLRFEAVEHVVPYLTRDEGYGLLQGRVIEMVTGQGKTLTVMLPSPTLAMAGIPVQSRRARARVEFLGRKAGRREKLVKENFISAQER